MKHETLDKRNCIRILVVLALVIISTACNTVNGSFSNQLPSDINIPDENIDTYMKLMDSPALQNSHKNGELLMLDLVNLSETAIIFPADFGIKMFFKNGQTWNTVQNYFSYPEEDNPLPTKKDYPLGQLFGCQPYLENLSSPVVIKIVVIGNIEDKPDQLVMAQINVTIIP